MSKKIVALLLALSMVLVACSNNNEKETNMESIEEGTLKTNEEVSNSDSKLKVVTSFFPIYDLVKNVGKDKVEVVNLTKTGSAHGYEPSIQDMEDIIKSDLLVVNGAHFEGWLDKIKDENLTVLTMSDFVDVMEDVDHDHDHEDADHDHDHEDADHDHDHEDADHDHDHEDADHDHDHEDADHDHDHEDVDHDHDHEEHHHDHGGVDPHFWTNPANAKKMLKAIKDKLVELDTSNKEFYESNFEQYDKEFDILIKEYNDSLSKYKGKSIVVPHKAFSYIFKPYGIEQIAMAGINSTDDPNTGKMVEIVNELKEHGINTVFYEYGHSDKVAKTIASEIDGKVNAISTFEVINEEDINNGETLASLMRMNLKNIVDSFEGE